MPRIPHTLVIARVLVLILALAPSFVAAATTQEQTVTRIPHLYGSNPHLSIPSVGANYIPLYLTVDDPIQKLLGTWRGTWSGTSVGRSNSGQTQPTSPIGGGWIINLQTVDVNAKTASGTLTWNGRDVYWTYTLDSHGNILTATPNDFIPDRTIKFDSSNTTLTAPAPGAGPQYGLTIDGSAHAQNPSDAFYGPWFSIGLFPDSGTAMSAGNGFLTHPYDPKTFATGLSSGGLNGSKGTCDVGTKISNVSLPEVTVQLALPRKPWQIQYGSLGLDFTLTSPPQNALCEAQSNVGSLNVLGRPLITGTERFMPFAHSIASATVTTFKGSLFASPLSTCFEVGSGIVGNCLLNGPFDPNAYYLKWHTEGFTTEVNVLHLAGEPDILKTGPLTFWVNLNALGLSPETTSMESIIRNVEPGIHTTLINHLPLISTYTVIQDPGKVSLFVIKDNSVGTGMPSPDLTVTNIPRSLYYQSDTNPAVILINPDPGKYQIIVNGLASGDYALSVSTTSFPFDTATENDANGNIVKDNSLFYNLNLTSSAAGTQQIFNPIPIAFQSLRLVMEDLGTQPNSAVAIDSILQTRDPFHVLNTQNLLNQGSDRNTRIQLFVSNLSLAPGETATALGVQAIDSGNNVYNLTVDDVRPVPNLMFFYQITVRLPDNLPAGTLAITVGLHGQVSNPGTIRIKN